MSDNQNPNDQSKNEQNPNENDEKPQLVTWLGEGEKPQLVSWFEKVSDDGRLVDLDGWEPYEDMLRNLEKAGKLRILRTNGRLYSTRAPILKYLNERSQAKPTSVPWAKSSEAIDAGTPNELEGRDQHE